MMRRLVAAELRKAWHSRAFLVVLAGLLAANLFLLWVGTGSAQQRWAPQAYRTMNGALAGKTMQQKTDFVAEELRRTKALSIIDGVLRSEAYSGGHTDKTLREQYAAEFAEFYDTYKAGGFLVYTDTLSDEYRFLDKINAECTAVGGYNAFLDSVGEKATQLSAISIFADSEDGYDLANIDATAKAYEGMRGTVIDYMPQKGIYTALDFSLTDVISVCAMLLIATVLVRGERDNGLLVLIRTTPAGRLKTGVAKLLALAASLLVVLLLLYGVNLAYCEVMYGLGDLSRSIQSVPALMRSTLKLNVAGYLGLFLLTKWGAAFVAGVWVMLAMLAARRPFTGYLGALALLGANLLIRSIIPATSRLNVLKYANLVSLLRTNELIGGYRNLYWFGRPVPLVLVEGVTAAVAFAAFVAAFCVLFARAQLLTVHRLVLPQRSKAKFHATTVFRTELYKLLVMNGAIVFLVLFGAYGVYTALTTESYINADEIYYAYYMKQVEGPITPAKIEWLKEANEEFRPIYDLQKALGNGKLSNDEYTALMQQYYGLQQKMNAFQIVVSRMQYLSVHPRAQFVYESGYAKLFDLQDKNDTKDTLEAALLCAVCFAGLFAMEKQTGMAKVVGATPLGRQVTVRSKLRVATLASGALTLFSVLPRFWVVLRDYGLGAFLAPSYSMTQYDGMIDIPLFFMLLLFVGARFIAIRALCGGVLALSQKLGNLFSALFAGSILAGLPLLLSLSGMQAAKWASVYPAFHAAALFTSQSGAVAVLLWLVALCGVIWLCDAYLYDNFALAQ